jgi:hypothetical protein
MLLPIQQRLPYYFHYIPTHKQISYFFIWQSVFPLQAWTNYVGSRRLRFLDQHMKVVRLSDLCTGHLNNSPPPRKYSWCSFLLETESTPGPLCCQKDYVNNMFQCPTTFPSMLLRVFSAAHSSTNRTGSDITQAHPKLTIPIQLSSFNQIPIHDQKCIDYSLHTP